MTLASLTQEREEVVVVDGGNSSDEDSQQPLSERTFSKIAGFAGTLGTEQERHEYKQLTLLAQLGRRPPRRKSTAPVRLDIGHAWSSATGSAATWYQPQADNDDPPRASSTAPAPTTTRAPQVDDDDDDDNDDDEYLLGKMAPEGEEESEGEEELAGAICTEAEEIEIDKVIEIAEEEEKTKPWRAVEEQELDKVRGLMERVGLERLKQRIVSLAAAAALVPLLDILNHRPGALTEWTTSHRSTIAVRVNAAVGAGEAGGVGRPKHIQRRPVFSQGRLAARRHGRRARRVRQPRQRLQTRNS